MATYPLKNIAIGGNTYQIQGGEFYVVEIETSNTSADDFAAFPSKTHIISDSTVTVYDKDGNVQSGFDFTKLLSAPCIAHIITHGSGGNIDSYAELIGVDASSAPTYFSISFESDWKSPSYVSTRYGIILEILQNGIDAVDGYALEIGGGGGGGSNLCLTLKTTTGGNMTFAQCIENTSFRLFDNSTNTAKSFIEIMDAYAAGIPIIIQDSSPE